MKIKKVLPVIVVLSLIVYGAFYYLNQQSNHAKDNIYYGTVEASASNICAEAAGIIDKLNVELGDRIDAGHSIGSINVKENETRLQLTELALEKAQRELEDIRDNSRLAGTSAEDNAAYLVEQAQKNKELAQLAIDKGTIKAAQTGIVDSINFKAGEYVAPGSPVVTVIDASDLWLDIFVPEEKLTMIALNKEAVLQNDFLPRINIKGKVIYISQDAEYIPMNVITKADRSKLVYRVRIKLMDHLEDIKPGLLMDVRIE